MTSPADKWRELKSRIACAIGSESNAGVGDRRVVYFHRSDWREVLDAMEAACAPSANGTSERAAGVREGLERALEICCIIGDENVANTDEANGAEKCERSIRARLTASPGNGQATTNAAHNTCRRCGLAIYREFTAQETCECVPAEAAPSHGGQSELTAPEVDSWLAATDRLMSAIPAGAMSGETGMPAWINAATRKFSEGKELVRQLSARSSTPPIQPAEGPTPLPRFRIKDNGEPIAAADGDWVDADDARTLERQRDDLAGQNIALNLRVAELETALLREQGVSSLKGNTPASATPQSQWSTPDGWKLVCEKCGSGLQEPCGWPNNCEAEAPPRPVEKGAEP